MEDRSKKRTRILIGIVTHLTTLSAGMSLEFSTIILPVLTRSTNPYAINNNQASWIASSVGILYPLGCISSSMLSDKYGRKPMIILSNFVAVIGWLIISLAYWIPIHQYMLIIIGSLITGFSGGMVLTMPVLYMTEIATPSTRSMFTTWNNIALDLGMMIDFLLGALFPENWNKVATTAIIMPIISAILSVICLPESPEWLILNNRLEEADRCFKLLGHHQSSENEQVERTPLLQPSNPPSSSAPLYRLLLKPTSWKPIIIVIAYLFFLQFSGVFVLLSYTVDFAERLRINLNPYWLICIIGATYVVGAVLLGVISNNFGRRPISLISGLVMSLSMLGIAVYLFAVSKYYVSDQSFLLNLAIVFLVVMYFFACSAGFGAVPYAMSSEMFPLDVRGFACGFVTCISCVFMFIAIKFYYSMITWLGSYFMLLFFYGVITLLGTIFVYFYLPETKGKTIEEIEQCFI